MNRIFQTDPPSWNPSTRMVFPVVWVNVAVRVTSRNGFA